MYSMHISGVCVCIYTYILLLGHRVVIMHRLIKTVLKKNNRIRDVRAAHSNYFNVHIRLYPLNGQNHKHVTI